MSRQVDYDHGSRVMGEIVHYLKERKEGFSRWSRTLFEFKRAPMTVIWGVQDPVAVIAMADRIKKEGKRLTLFLLQVFSMGPTRGHVSLWSIHDQKRLNRPFC